MKKFCGIVLFLWAALGIAASPTPAPTLTPTPRPRLSGGFGRPAATPAGAPDTGPSNTSPNQNLNDVVRAAEEGKARKESPGVAITNDSLVTDPRKGKLTTSSPRNAVPPTPARSSEPARAAAVTPAAVPAASNAGTEEEWRERARSARGRVDELKQRVAQLEAESKKLENDFYSWDDGSYRDGVIKPAWDRKKEDLEVARKDLTQAEADLADLPERARKAGALPGWLRE